MEIAVVKLLPAEPAKIAEEVIRCPLNLQGV